MHLSQASGFRLTLVLLLGMIAWLCLPGLAQNIAPTMDNSTLVNIQDGSGNTPHPVQSRAMEVPQQPNPQTTGSQGQQGMMGGGGQGQNQQSMYQKSASTSEAQEKGQSNPV